MSLPNREQMIVDAELRMTVLNELKRRLESIPFHSAFLETMAANNENEIHRCRLWLEELRR